MGVVILAEPELADTSALVALLLTMGNPPL
jgi:hypothetical protein